VALEDEVTPFYQDEAVCIYHGDCRDVLPCLPVVDYVLTDPPYGINWQPRVTHKDQAWCDDEQFDALPWLDIGREHVFWGANYFARALPHSADWLAWVKRPIDFDFSADRRSYATVELAWSDLGCRARFMAHTWDGGMRAGLSENRSFCHPAQKPAELMLWCLSLSKTNGTVLDPFMGSGTTLVAAKRMGRKAIGIERERKYCELAVERLAQGALGLEMTA
jgi:site-specific DNA-methyltransferase (adenine-specific)